MEGFPRAVGEPYMSPRAVYATRAFDGAPPRRGGDFYRTAPAARRTGSGGAGDLEPDAGLVLVAADAPPVGHLVDEHEAEAARLERLGVTRLARRGPVRGNGQFDLRLGDWHGPPFLGQGSPPVGGR